MHSRGSRAQALGRVLTIGVAQNTAVPIPMRLSIWRRLNLGEGSPSKRSPPFPVGLPPKGAEGRFVLLLLLRCKPDGTLSAALPTARREPIDRTGRVQEPLISKVARRRVNDSVAVSPSMRTFR